MQVQPLQQQIGGNKILLFNLSLSLFVAFTRTHAHTHILSHTYTHAHTHTHTHMHSVSLHLPSSYSRDAVFNQLHITLFSRLPPLCFTPFLSLSLSLPFYLYVFLPLPFSCHQNNCTPRKSDRIRSGQNLAILIKSEQDLLIIFGHSTSPSITYNH